MSAPSRWVESDGTSLASCFRWSGNLFFIRSYLSAFNSIVDNRKSARESTSMVSNFDPLVFSATISSSQALTVAYKAFIRCKRIFCRDVCRMLKQRQINFPDFWITLKNPHFVTIFRLLVFFSKGILSFPQKSFPEKIFLGY